MRPSGDEIGSNVESSAAVEEAYAAGIEAGRYLERGECRDAIKKHIHPGDIGGDGLDKHAQRNGMILALNIIDERIRQAPNSQALPHGVAERTSNANRD